MNTRAWYTAMAIALGAALGTACVVSTDDDEDDPIEDLDDDASTGGSAADDDDSSPGGATGSGGSGGVDGTGGGAGGTGEPAGTCDTPMESTCAACLEDADKGFTAEWAACEDTYPCCEESSRYVLCMQQAVEDNELWIDQFETAEDYCFDSVVAGLDIDEADVSEAFYGLTAEALSGEVVESCYVDCFLPE